MLTQCPECTLPVSDKALTCPHCGFPRQNVLTAWKPQNRRRRYRRLPNGFGQISEIKNRNLRKPFRAMVTVGKTPEGRPICKPLKPEAYFATYNDAYVALVEYNKNPCELDQAVTVGELYEQWLAEYRETVKSTRVVENAWQYCSSVYRMRVTDLRARHVKTCMEKGTATVHGVEQHPSASMKNRIKTLFNLLLDYALEYELVERNYARTFKLTEETIKEIQTVKKEHMAFTDEELEKLWAAVGRVPGVDVLLIQCYSGWRPQELGLLEVCDTDLAEWRFRGGMKTEAGTDRDVPIHPRIRPLVEARYREAVQRGSAYLLNWTEPVRQKSPMLTYHKYRKIFESIVAQLALDPAHRPHDGRTHFVTTAKRYEVDEYAIKYMVGHKISDITEKVYTKRQFDWLRQELEKIP